MRNLSSLWQRVILLIDSYLNTIQNSLFPSCWLKYSAFSCMHLKGYYFTKKSHLTVSAKLSINIYNVLKTLKNLPLCHISPVLMARNSTFKLLRFTV